MSEEGEGPSVSDKLSGAFIILFGFCMALAGGAYAIAAGAGLLHPSPYDPVELSLFVLLIAITVAVGGLFMMRSGLRVTRDGLSPKPERQRGRRHMADKPEGVHVSDILIGTFIILFGLCFTLAGGACAMMWVGMLFQSTGGATSMLMLLVSLGAVAFGLFILYHGQRIARSGYRNR